MQANFLPFLGNVKARYLVWSVLINSPFFHANDFSPTLSFSNVKLEIRLSKIIIFLGYWSYICIVARHQLVCQYIFVVIHDKILNKLTFNTVIKVAHAEVSSCMYIYRCLVQNCKYSIRLKYIPTQLGMYLWCIFVFFVRRAKKCKTMKTSAKFWRCSRTIKLAKKKNRLTCLPTWNILD